ncbi:MAG: hypothetical protein ACLPIX_23345 [Rhodomicrobium sp.]
MNRFISCRGMALCLFSAFVFAAAPVVAGGVAPNDTARFLAGMKAVAGTPLEPLTQEKAFARYAEPFDRAWAELEARQLSKVRAWSSENLTKPQPTLFYMFSGPDFLYANAFFPKADTYVMAGLELPGEIPDIAGLPKSSISHELGSLRSSLKSVLSYSFFITKEMRKRLYGRHLTGALPVLYVFLARSGKTIQSVSFVELDKDGTLHPASAAEPEEDTARGVKIAFHGENNQQQTLYYFRTDLSNEGTQNSGFLKFCERFGAGDALLKSASYLPHSDNFSQVRTFLLKQSTTIVQDDSGIPLKNFESKEWDVQPFGRYVRPLSIFPRNYQPNMLSLFESQHAQPLQFSIGYRWKNRNSSLLLAVKKPARPEQASSQPLPETVARATEAR